MPSYRLKRKVLVVIPWLAAGAQGRELEYAVAGWRRHFKEDYLIVLTGNDGHPVLNTGKDITWIPSERVPDVKGQYRQHLDYVSCLRKVHAAFPEHQGFVMVADDCYAVNDFDIADILFLKQQKSNMDEYSTDSTNGWQRDKAKTREKLRELGYPTRNFTTHLPQYYEWDRLEMLWEDFGMDRSSYVMEDLYYNIFFRGRIPFTLNLERDNLKCGIYRSNPRIPVIESAFKNKIWITNSPDGWIPELDRMLDEYYFKRPYESPPSYRNE